MNKRFAVNPPDPRQALARRLRALREDHWPGVKVKQAQLAAALGGTGKPVSVPLISSWESRTNPQVPPGSRIQDIATFFATPRSLDGRASRLLSPDKMTVQERVAREELLDELTRLRREALDAGADRPSAVIPGTLQEIARSLSEGPYRFEPDQNITIVCAQLPQEMLQRMPYTDPSDPNFTESYRYSDTDSLLELFGHLRAANPASRVEFRAAHELRPDDYTAHLVALGGVDWNQATSSVLERLQLPVKQVNKWDVEGGTYFEVTGEDGGKVAHRPRLGESRGQMILREDVALFARAASPFNRKRFVTICNGMYGRGTYGAVRALTDERFRDRNMEYIQARFASSEAFCLLTRVPVANGVTLTPDWTVPGTVLFEWSRPQ
jgi:hypothetical protein